MGKYGSCFTTIKENQGCVPLMSKRLLWEWRKFNLRYQQTWIDGKGGTQVNNGLKSSKNKEIKGETLNQEGSVDPKNID